MMEKSNRDDWLEKVQSELKGAELDELDTILPSGLERSLLHVASDSPVIVCVSVSTKLGSAAVNPRNGSRACTSAD